MFRAVAFAARLGFSLDPPVVEGIRRQRHLIASASPARLIEEYYKVLRSGAAEQTFRLLAEHGLLEPITPELHRRAGQDALWKALAELDRFRRKFDAVPDGLTNAVLLGTLLVPLGLMPMRRPAETAEYDRGDTTTFASGAASDADASPLMVDPRRRRERRPPKEPPLRIGLLAVARRDTERLRQILSLQRRLIDIDLSPRAKRALMHRGFFPEALVWLEIHGRAPEALEAWRGFIDSSGPLTAHEAAEGAAAEGALTPHAPRRRRRRGRRRGGGGFNPSRPS
jgi:hypothetical protein